MSLGPVSLYRDMHGSLKGFQIWKLLHQPGGFHLGCTSKGGHPTLSLSLSMSQGLGASLAYTSLLRLFIDGGLWSFIEPEFGFTA